MMNLSKSKPIHLLLALFLISLLSGCSTLQATAREAAQPAQQSLLRVTVTSQGYVYHRPWQQRRPVTQTAIGVIMPGGMVLVNGLLVADHRYIELETLDNQRKAQGRVVVADYEANLALIAPLDPGFLAGRQPLPLAREAAIGENLTIWQVRPTGDILPVTGQMTSVELGLYLQDNYFLTYRLNGSLQYRFNNLTLPVVKNGALAGMVLRQSQNGQTIEVIATSVIRHFLEDASDGNYQGFPMAGFHYGPMVDPQLRRYIGLPAQDNGIYVQKVIKGGPAAKAGLQAGDVVQRLGDLDISNTGQVQHPLYGRISLVHSLRTFYQAGDRVVLKVFRKNQVLDLPMVLEHRKPEEYLVPPYAGDKPPEYLIVGGLVLQELSIPYLREYGSDWASTAPVHLLYYQQCQDYLNGDGREKIVVLSQVIPTPYTIGYENLSNLVVTAINGRKIGKLSDVRQALSIPVDGFDKIELQQQPKLLFLDPKELPQINQLISQRYGIPTPSLTP